MYRRVHPSSVVEQFDSYDVPTASQSLAGTAVRLFSEQESSQHRKVTTSLGWGISICAGPPATLDCKKRSDSRLAEWGAGGGVLVRSCRTGVSIVIVY